ncbi:sigma-70 family RNA polymerase sigma factor [Streptomyces sp. NBC_01353]|uniref:sigma-70 family RNA polymerase sigma factor n=1 Tax=Streptomyces sp. NBC_01353 TaxID=2903835 RepID=UPI002E346B44|nr:sigma-70 family RNA polymerase sigma factor [Streptomyces sp. NBC_01353]
MTGADDTLTEEQAERMLAAMNEIIRAGEEMRQLRAEMIQLFASLGWTQDRIARIADMSQPAVSKQVAKHKPADPPPPPMELSLDQRDIPWLEGRLWGLAEEISEICDDTARCAHHVEAIARGKKRFTPQNVDALRRLVEEDLIRNRERLPAAFRDAYDVISRGLDVPAKVTSTGSPAGSPSARRTLAHRIQRDRLRNASRA